MVGKTSLIFHPLIVSANAGIATDFLGCKSSESWVLGFSGMDKRTSDGAARRRWLRAGVGDSRTHARFWMPSSPIRAGHSSILIRYAPRTYTREGRSIDH